jgi:hypothetical protein
VSIFARHGRSTAAAALAPILTVFASSASAIKSSASSGVFMGIVLAVRASENYPLSDLFYTIE